MFLSNSVAQELKGLRKKRGLTLDQTVFNVEHGKTSPTLETLLLMLKALDARMVIEPFPMPEDLQ